MARTHRRLAFLLAGAAVAVLAGVLAVQAPAAAGHVHLIQTANSPSTGTPVLGGGSWIVNKPSGYYVGRAMVGSVFDNEVTSSGDWHFGRASTTVNMCGWVMPGSLGASQGDTGDTCSTATQNDIVHRRTIGRDYNQPAHATGDGTAASANTGCVVQYNYFVGSDYGSNGGHWANPAGNAAGTVFYRFTTNDGAAVVVRDPNLGWGFLPIGCVQRPSALYNDND